LSVSANADIWWDQMTTVARQMVPQNGAGILNLGAVDFAAPFYKIAKTEGAPARFFAMVD